MYDMIGDIHGHADELRHLLTDLGYIPAGSGYRHPERKAVFLGDFVDRGPKILEALQIVRPMVEEGHALAVIGNHELNALAYHTPAPDGPGEYLRPHTGPNTAQHQETLDQVPPGDLRSYLNWFRSLPLWLDLDGIRVIHACWDDEQMHAVAKPIDDDFLFDAYRKGRSLHEPIEVLIKGKEAKLPTGVTITAKGGQIREDMRVRWYLPPEGHTYRTYSLNRNEVDCDEPLGQSVKDAARPYPADAKPVFIGHYSLTAAAPYLLADNVACVDWGYGKGGFLCAYQWDGEQRLDAGRFRMVPTRGH